MIIKIKNIMTPSVLFAFISIIVIFSQIFGVHINMWIAIFVAVFNLNVTKMNVV
jgi:hypothetical protein